MENILRDCAEKLISAANTISSASTTTGTVQPTAVNTPVTNIESSLPASSGITNTVTDINGSNQSSTALGDHRRIFGYRPPTALTRLPMRRPAQSTGRGRRSSTPYSMSSSSVSKPNTKNTFTKAFVCLPKTNQTIPPNAAERISLSLIGLGEQKIIFEKQGESQHVHDKILETFPALGNCGGYEILRTSDGNSRQLIDVPCPPMGYTVNFLKSALGQAKAFVRPLQQDIPLDMEEPKEIHNSPKVHCINCNEQIALAEMRQHQSSCGGGPSNQSEESGQVQRHITEFISPDEDSDSDGSVANGGSMTSEEKLQELQQLFPETKANLLSQAIAEALGDINQAANSILLGKVQSDDVSVDDDDSAFDELLITAISKRTEYSKTCEISISSIVKSLNKKLTGRILKVNVDDEDILSDALVVYKYPQFDASRPLRITFANQPAIDTRGPRREFYEKIYAKLANGADAAFQLFEGPPMRLVPTYNMRIVFSGVMKCVGKMIAHSISQCGIGFSRLSPVCYWYLVYQDIDKAISFAEVSDIHDMDVASCVDKIVNVETEEDVNILNGDDTFLSILSDIGSTSILSLRNKDEIVQCILCHFLINKRKVLLDQLREGLKTLGVLNEMIKFPQVLAPMFLAQEEFIDSFFVKSMLIFPLETDGHVVRHMLLHFIDESRIADLKNFLCFVPGSCSVRKLQTIDVTFDAMGGAIHASTCMESLHLPPDVESYQCFEQAMKTAIMDSGPSFNTM